MPEEEVLQHAGENALTRHSGSMAWRIDERRIQGGCFTSSPYRGTAQRLCSASQVCS
jgi:hypothetical protein